MKIRYNFLFSFAFMLFILFGFSSPVRADVLSDDFTKVTTAIDDLPTSQYSFMIASKCTIDTTYPNIESYQYYYSDSPFDVTINNSADTNQYYVNASGTSVSSFTIAYGTKKDGSTNVIIKGSTFYNPTGTHSPVSSVTYVNSCGGDVTNNTSCVSSSFTSLSDDDILNFNWTGNGLKIYNLKKDMKVSGYANQQTGLKWFDIEVYGKFVSSQSSWFSSFAKKSMQTKLQNNCYVTICGQTRHVGEGLGIKSFEWVNSDSVAVGTELKFRMVVTAPMLVTGVGDVIIGTTIPDGSEYISDTVKDINFLSSNSDSYGKPPVDGGSSGYVDNINPGNSSTYKNDDSAGSGIISIFTSIGNNIISFFKMILEVLTSVSSIAPQIATAFSALFMFLPSPIPQLITASFAIIIFVAVLHFLRG